MTEMSEQEAAAKMIEEPEPVAEEAPAVEEPVAEKKALIKIGPPARRFRWIDDSDMTVETWLAGMATADIEVFPGVVFRFREAHGDEMREGDAIVNSMGPSFVMTGLIQPDKSRDDFMRGEQWARARHIVMLALSITHMGGDAYPVGKTLRDRFKVIDGLGHIKIDFLIAAFSEFTSQLAYMVENTDLPNS